MTKISGSSEMSEVLMSLSLFLVLAVEYGAADSEAAEAASVDFACTLGITVLEDCLKTGRDPREGDELIYTKLVKAKAYVGKGAT